MPSIPMYKVRPDDYVMVRNYRTKDERWEMGKCLDAEYHVYRNGGHWSYRVLLARMSPKGNAVILYVGDESVQIVRSVP